MRESLVAGLVILEQELIRAENLIESQAWRGWGEPAMEDCLDHSSAFRSLLYIGREVWVHRHGESGRPFPLYGWVCFRSFVFRPFSVFPSRTLFQTLFFYPDVVVIGVFWDSACWFTFEFLLTLSCILLLGCWKATREMSGSSCGLLCPPFSRVAGATTPMAPLWTPWKRSCPAPARGGEGGAPRARGRRPPLWFRGRRGLVPLPPPCVPLRCSIATWLGGRRTTPRSRRRPGGCGSSFLQAR